LENDPPEENKHTSRTPFYLKTQYPTFETQ